MAAAAAEKQASQGKENAAGDLSIQQETISTPILTTERERVDPPAVGLWSGSAGPSNEVN